MSINKTMSVELINQDKPEMQSRTAHGVANICFFVSGETGGNRDFVGGTLATLER